MPSHLSPLQRGSESAYGPSRNGGLAEVNLFEHSGGRGNKADRSERKYGRRNKEALLARAGEAILALRDKAKQKGRAQDDSKVQPPATPEAKA